MRIFYGIQFIAGYERNGAFVRLRHRAHERFRSRAQLFRQKFIYAQIGGKLNGSSGHTIIAAQTTTNILAEKRF